MNLKHTDQILYVDDEQENLTVFKYTFNKYYKVHTALSAKEGVEILRNNDIQIIITDQRMPEVTGIEFLESIITEFPDTIRIILTGFSDIEAVINAINKGKVYKYIKKPWDNNDFKITIDNALEAYNLKQDNKKLLLELQDANSKLKDINQELETNIEELKVAKNKAEESDKLKSAFLANISHEIRTPLNAILGYTHLMTSRELPADQKTEFEGYISSGSKRLLNLIDDVITLSKIESEQIEITKNTFRLNSFLKEFLDYCNIRINECEKENINISLQTQESEDFKITTDGQKLKQIFKKLLDNALKFTNQGLITFGYEVQENENQILFYIIDTGKGISIDKQNIIFEKFTKIDLDPLKLHEGTGLGLAISKSYVDLLGGSIWLESEPEEGTKFYFTLPMSN